MIWGKTGRSDWPGKDGMRVLVILSALAASAFAQPTPTYSFAMVAPIESPEMAATKGDTDWQFAISQQWIKVKITNRGADTVRLLWNESAWIDWRGVSHRLVPTTARVMDINAVIPPLVVAGSSSATAEAIHADMLARVADKVIHLRLLPFCPKCDETVGKTVGLLLAVERGGQRSDYRFDFKVLSASVP